MEQRTAILGVGNTITIAAATADTGGAFALLDYELAPGFAGLPPHMHRDEDAAAYILEGRLLVQIGESERLVGAGGFVFLPRGIAHAYSNPTHEPARFLALLIPAGFERCFQDLETVLGTRGSLSSQSLTPLLGRYRVQRVGDASAEWRLSP